MNLKIAKLRVKSKKATVIAHGSWTEYRKDEAMKQKIIIYATAVLFMGSALGASAANANDTLASNGVAYPSWHWNLLSGMTCLVKANVELNSKLDFELSTSLMPAGKDEKQLSLRRKYEGFIVSAVEAIYLPPYFHVSNTYIWSSLNTRDSFHAYAESKPRVDPIVSRGQQKIYLLIKPLETPQGAKMEILQILGENEVNQAIKLIEKLPHYESDELGFHMKSRS